MMGKLTSISLSNYLRRIESILIHILLHLNRQLLAQFNFDQTQDQELYLKDCLNIKIDYFQKQVFLMIFVLEEKLFMAMKFKKWWTILILKMIYKQKNYENKSLNLYEPNFEIKVFSKMLNIQMDQLKELNSKSKSIKTKKTL